MQIRRGRPKKVVEVQPDDGISKEISKGNKDAETKDLAAPLPLPTQTAFLNKTFHFDDGTNCTVMYSGCKSKPIDIKHGKRM
jgi:hypothetical protein